jgi:hypothetical protein
MPKRRGRKSAAQTPAPRSERIYGSKKNKPGSASSEKSASKIVLSQEITDALKKKADEYNEKHSNKVSLSDLKAVFRRGAGAYSKSHRPTITGGRPNSRNAWAYARVNKFLKKKAGQKVKAAYVQDDDLLANGGELKDAQTISILNNVEIEFLKNWISKDINASGVLRKFMDKEDIKMANSLVKKGWMEKGFSDDTTHSIIYYVDLPRDKREQLESSFEGGGYILVRNDDYDTSMTKRRLPYLGVSAFSIKESDFDGLKQYAQREYEVAPESWTILKIEDFGNCTVSAMKMEETNDYVMQFSDQKPIQEQYQPEKHSLNFEDGSVDYEDAYEVMIQPVPKYFQGGMAAMLLKDTIDSADNINAIVVYSLENDVNPKKLSEKEFNEKINPEGKYSDFEVRLAKRELNRYFADGGQTETMEITCQKCGWSWDSSETTPEEMMICHKCGHNNLLPVESEPSTSPYTDTIQMNGPAFLRALEFAREDAKTDMDLHKLTENAIRLSKSGLITMEQYEQMVPEVKMADEGAMVMEEPVEEKYISVEEYIQKEKDEAEAVECCEMSKLSKIMICQGKIDLAENKIKETESVSEQQAWLFIESIWRKCLNNISKNYKKGGETDCGCSKFDNGGLAYGNSHDNGGMPLVVKSTGQNIEIEGGEGVVNKRSMKIDKKVEFEGKKMTPCEVVSKINQMGGGVKFKCDDVKDIIAEDGNF